MDEISCPLCERSASVPVISEDGFTGRQCGKCGLIFISPRPTRQEIDEVYEQGEAHLSPEFFVQGPEAVASLLRAERDARLARRHAPGGSLLEIGPGRGTFLSAARRRGFDVYGVELNPTQAEYIRTEQGIPCAESLDAAAELRTGGAGQFDVIYHRDVISHFYDPLEEMGRLRDLLKPGGLHIFETGNLADVDHRYFKLMNSFQYPDHLFFYGDRSLQKLLDQTGFDRVHTYHWSILPERWMHAQVKRAMRRAGAGVKETPATVNSPAPTANREEVARPDAAGAYGAGEAIVRQGLDLMYQGMQMTLGRIPVSGRVPQTLILVSRKR